MKKRQPHRSKPRRTDLRKLIGQRLVIAREAHGLRQIDVARATDEYAAKISRWESGEYFPSEEWLIKIRKLYRIDPNYLLLGELDGLPPKLREKIKEIEERKANDSS